MSDIEVVEILNTIIRLQSQIIDKLFLLLAQLISAEELDSLPVLDLIKEAANLRADVERGRRQAL